MMKKRKAGFTLVELIVVLVIIAILAAIVVPAFTKYIEKTDKAKGLFETGLIVKAAKSAYIDYVGSHGGVKDGVILNYTKSGIGGATSSPVNEDFKKEVDSYLNAEIDGKKIVSLLYFFPKDRSRVLAITYQYDEKADVVYYVEVTGDSIMTTSIDEWFEFMAKHEIGLGDDPGRS